jgi:hypothetical protein
MKESRKFSEKPRKFLLFEKCRRMAEKLPLVSGGNLAQGWHDSSIRQNPVQAQIHASPGLDILQTIRLIPYVIINSKIKTKKLI